MDIEEAERNERRTCIEKRDTVVQVCETLAHDRQWAERDA